MNIKLSKITIKNFRSIKFAELDLSHIGMVQLNGKSGHGKSSLFWAISYVLGFCPGPQVQLPTWRSTAPMSVGLEFFLNGEKIWVHRGTDFVGCSGPGEYSAIHGATSVNSRLQTLLKLTPEMVSLLTYRPQQEIGSFIRKTDAEKKEFLTKILRLDKFEAAQEASSQTLKALEPRENYAWNTVNTAEKSLEEAREQLVPYPRVDDIDYIKKLIQKLNSKATELSDQIKTTLADNSIITQKKSDLESLSHQLDKALVNDESEATRFIMNKRSIQQQISRLQNKRTKWNQDKRQWLALTEELQIAKEGKCPTCSSPVTNETLVDAIANEREKLNENSLEFTNEDAEGLKNLEECLITPRPVSTIIEDIRRYMAKLQGEVTYESLRKESFVKEQKMELEKNNLELIQLKKDLSSLEFIKNQADKSRELIKNKEKHLEDSRKLLKEVERQISTERDFGALVGNKGFLGLIFDEVLQDIADTTNLMLGKIPNTTSVAIQFKSDNLTQKGTTKRAIVPVVSVSGNEGPLDIVLSGGMKTVVALAIDLAIAQVVARRTGVHTQWLMLDEVFDGCDSNTRESMLELLALQSKDKLVLVVDHAVDTADLFTDKINVKLLNGETVIYGNLSSNNEAST